MTESDLFFALGSNPTSGAPAAQVSGAVGTAVSQLTLPSIATKITKATGGIMRLVVVGTQPVTWCFGSNSQLTTSNGVTVLGNSVEKFHLPANVTQISVVASATGSTAYVSVSP